MPRNIILSYPYASDFDVSKVPEWFINDGVIVD